MTSTTLKRRINLLELASQPRDDGFVCITPKTLDALVQKGAYIVEGADNWREPGAKLVEGPGAPKQIWTIAPDQCENFEEWQGQSRTASRAYRRLAEHFEDIPLVIQDMIQTVPPGQREGLEELNAYRAAAARRYR